MKAVLLVSHGSRSPKTKEEVEALVNRLKDRVPADILRYAFLELESPDISAGIKQCVGEGATEILVLLNFLNSGRHVDDDIPKIVKETSRQFPDVKISLSCPVGQHENIDELFLDLINRDES